MSEPRKASDGTVPSASAPEPPVGVLSEEMAERENLTLEAKDVREAIRFGHTDAEERFREFDERCETFGWGRSIADRLFRLLYRDQSDPASKAFLNALATIVKKLREVSTLWRAPVRRDMERLAEIPQAAGIIPVLEAERDARIRLEKAEAARARAKAERDEAERTETRRRNEASALHERWQRFPETLEDALDAADAPGEIRSTALAAWRGWTIARTERAKEVAVLDAMERDLATLPASPDRTAFDESGIELHTVEGISGIYEVAAALNDRIKTLSRLTDWEREEPKLEEVPVSESAETSPPWDEFKRQARENVIASAAFPIGFLFRNVKYWAWSGGMLFLASCWIPSLGRLACGTENSFWRPVFSLFIVFFGPLLSFIWRLNREKIEELHLYAKWAAEIADGRIATLAVISASDGDLSALLSECEEIRKMADTATADAIRIVKETQGFLTWIFDANERSSRAENAFYKSWGELFAKVAATESLAIRKKELARRNAEWHERGNMLAVQNQEAFTKLQIAVESTRNQIDTRRFDLTAALDSAVESVDMALDEIQTWANRPNRETEAILNTAACEADDARREWEASKIATDVAVAKAEEEEKRRAQERMDFARLKKRIIPIVENMLSPVRTAVDSSPEIQSALTSLDGDLTRWNSQTDVEKGGLEAEEQRGEGFRNCAKYILEKWAKSRLELARQALKDGRFDACIQAAQDASLCYKDKAEGLRDAAQKEINSRETEINQWKDESREARQKLPGNASWPWIADIAAKLRQADDKLQNLSRWNQYELAQSWINDVRLLLANWNCANLVVEKRKQQEESFHRKKTQMEQRPATFSLCCDNELYWDRLWRVGDESFHKGNSELAFSYYGKAESSVENILSALDNPNSAFITIPDGVTSIGSRAFYLCNKLTSIMIPSSVTSIGSHAFAGCHSLTSITIPNSVERIETLAFQCCSNLTSVTIPDSVTFIGECAFSGCTNLREIQMNHVEGRIIEDWAFSGCPGWKGA